MTEQPKMSRRKFLIGAAGVLGAGCIACSGLVYTGLQPSGNVDFAEGIYGGEMSKKVLIAYASRAGSTGEVAEAIAKTLVETSCQVDVRRVKDVKTVDGYDAVIVGTPYRMSKVLPEALSFVKKYARKLQEKPLAYFSLGTTLIEDTPERRKTAEQEIAEMVAAAKPLTVGYFAGAVDPNKLEPVWRFMMQWVKEGEMAPGDHRDWNKIDAWARELPGVLGLAG